MAQKWNWMENGKPVEVSEAEFQRRVLTEQARNSEGYQAYLSKGGTADYGEWLDSMKYSDRPENTPNPWKEY